METTVPEEANKDWISELTRSLGERFSKLESMVLDTQHVATEGAIWAHPHRRRGSDQLLQHLARNEWKRLAASNSPMPTFDEVQFRYFSQNGEDGIIWYLLSLVGDGSKRVVEICAGDGIECCSANLVVNHGWQALLFEGSSELVTRGQNFYEHCGDAWYFPPRFVNAWVTPDNINAHLAEYDFDHDVDVVIIDMDGNDYWMWNALELEPKLLVVEINETLGSEMSVVIPYDPDFRLPQSSNHRSASLRAFANLASRRGYRLVGTERYNFNAFFLRNDCVPDLIPEVSVESCLVHPKLREDHVRLARESTLAEDEWLDC
jgi:hypothetical protein